MKIILIRHGATLGNLSKCYIGSTDEPLTEQSCTLLSKKSYPYCNYIYVSPMIRCTQTAQIIYPKHAYIVCDNLRECNFGDFEGKNYLELAENFEYKKWVDSNGTSQFPNGETNDGFKNRCCDAFEKIIKSHVEDDIIAFVVHGGTIMSVLERFYIPTSTFYDWQIGNSSAYCLFCTIDDDKIILREAVTL